jgi:3-phosphoglycerate kinase
MSIVTDRHRHCKTQYPVRYCLRKANRLCVMSSFGRVSKKFQQEQDAKKRRELINELDVVFAEQERRVKNFVKTAAPRTIERQQEARTLSLVTQEADQLVHQAIHSIGPRRKRLDQTDGDPQE